MKACSDLPRAARPAPFAHALKRRRDRDLVANETHGGEIVGRREAGAGSVLAVFVGREPICRVETLRRVESPQAKCPGPIRSPPDWRPKRFVGPEAVNDKAVPGAGAHWRGDFSAPAKIAEARRPGERHHVEIEGRGRDRRADLRPRRRRIGENGRQGQNAAMAKSVRFRLTDAMGKVAQETGQVSSAPSARTRRASLSPIQRSRIGRNTSQCRCIGVLAVESDDAPLDAPVIPRCRRRR